MSANGESASGWRSKERVHELALDEGGRVVPEPEFAAVREYVRGVWHEVFADVESE